MSADGRPGSGFSADPRAVYAFVGRFFESLANAGVEHVCISPGSRSTPLALVAERTSGLRTWIGLDERASSFFGLGLAKATRRPVALVCTSGTAAANFLPAVIEAHYSRVPLIVLSADRPPELRDWGAGQTIDQLGLYGRYPRWATDVPVPAEGGDAIRYATRLGVRAVDEALGRPSGPVHLNWPLREPLAPDWTASAPHTATTESIEGPADSPPRISHSSIVARSEDVEELVARVRSMERGVICCGPMDTDESLVAALLAFSNASGWPILAGPTSQLRGNDAARRAPLLTTGDAILRAPLFASRMQPEIVLRVGETPVSKAQRLWIEASAPQEVWWLDEGWNWGEPSHRFTRIVRGGSASLLGQATEALRDFDGRARDWCRHFEFAEKVAREALDQVVSETGSILGLAVARRLSRGLKAGDTLFFLE